MSDKRFRRICILLIILASLPGPLSSGLQASIAMPQMNLEMTGDEPSAFDCPFCAEEMAIGPSVCALLCFGVAAILPEIMSADPPAAVAMAFVSTRYRAGLSLAPDPSPPRPVVSS
ncbi:MAG: hypothetical protein QF654_12470 [Alphaproteobacteria bacterium]|jgi:hypothetical protein|nr:hypothetical protein [Alphaproteobacteria bacterium]